MRYSAQTIIKKQKQTLASEARGDIIVINVSTDCPNYVWTGEKKNYSLTLASAACC